MTIVLPKTSPKYSATNYVLYLLSKREYSELELRQKLKLKAYHHDEIEQVIERALLENWQSDERFCRGYIRYRANQGYGPRRLKQELRLKGVKDSLIHQELENAEIDWFEIAERQFNKKRPDHDWDLKSKHKVYQYMIRHGFYHEHFSHLMEIDYNDDYDE